MIRKETTEIYITSDGEEYDTLQEAQDHEIFQGCLKYFTDLILPDYCETEKYTTSMAHEISNAVLENKEFLLNLLSENCEFEDKLELIRDCDTCSNEHLHENSPVCRNCSLIDKFSDINNWEAKE